MNFNESLEKEYYYSLEEAFKSPFKKNLWDKNIERILSLKESLFINYDIDEIYIINEFLEKNSTNEKISILIKADQKDLDDLVKENISVYVEAEGVLYKLEENKLKEVNLKIRKACKFNQT